MLNAKDHKYKGSSFVLSSDALAVACHKFYVNDREYSTGASYPIGKGQVIKPLLDVTQRGFDQKKIHWVVFKVDDRYMRAPRKQFKKWMREAFALDAWADVIELIEDERFY